MHMTAVGQPIVHQCEPVKLPASTVAICSNLPHVLVSAHPQPYLKSPFIDLLHPYSALATVKLRFRYFRHCVCDTKAHGVLTI